jgi:hypothetical protein
MSRLFRHCGILNTSQPCRPAQPVTDWIVMFKHPFELMDFYLYVYISVPNAAYCDLNCFDFHFELKSYFIIHFKYNHHHIHMWCVILSYSGTICGELHMHMMMAQTCNDREIEEKREVKTRLMCMYPSWRWKVEFSNLAPQSVSVFCFRCCVIWKSNLMEICVSEIHQMMNFMFW